MNKYLELKTAMEAPINQFIADNMVFAFNDKQFQEAVAMLKPTEGNKLVRIPAGGFMLRSKLTEYSALCEAHTAAQQAAILSDTTGDGYIFDMFVYELNNHEYCYTGDYEQTLEALGLTWNEVQDNPALKNGLTKAMALCREEN